ncbi:MAG: glycosyltransferase family 39 protein [Candidatus Eisenbacteria bacterium]
MTAISSSSAAPGRTRRYHQPGVVLASIALALFFAASLPLVDPDEGRNAEVSREMARSGDLVVPHLAGMPYLDKPPGLFWGAALAIRAFGPTRWAPRLPAILAATLTLVALAALARRVGGDTLAWRATALLASAPLFAVIGAYVIFDMPLALCVTLVWTLLARELSEGASRRRRAVMFAAVTLGVLLKGPVMFAWMIGGSGAVALVARSRAPLRWLGWLPGWLMVFGVAGGWFALATARHPEYPRYAFLEESLERMTRKSFDRNQPWWFAPVTLIGGALPWSLVTPWRMVRPGAKAAEGRDSAPGDRAATARNVALGFVLFALIFFTFSRSKLVTYLVPALPPLALLAAMAWNAKLARGARAWRVAFAASVTLAPLTLLAGWPALYRAAERESSEPLARAIAASRARSVRYERCYSAGADYLLDRAGTLVSARADQTTSVYQARYREVLRRRGRWLAFDDAALAPAADVVVRPVPDDVELPAGAVLIYRGRRFTAYKIEAR